MSMNNKLLGLALVALLATALLFQVQEEAPEETALLFDGLASSLEAVDQVTVMAPGFDSVTMTKSDIGWGVAEKSGYPVDFEKLHRLLNNLAKAQLIEAKTAIAANHGRLGLADSGDESETGVSVVASAGDNTFEIVIGNSSAHREGTFVRRPGEAQTWLVSENLTAEVGATDWIDLVAVDIESSTITEVAMKLASGDVLKATRSDDGGMVVADLPEGTELKYGTVGDTLGRALVNVRIEDVAPLDTSAWQSHNRAVFRTVAGDVITADTMMAGDARMLRLDFELAEGSELVALESKEAWQFEITSYAYEALTKTMDDMVNPVADGETINDN